MTGDYQILMYASDPDEVEQLTQALAHFGIDDPYEICSDIFKITGEIIPSMYPFCALVCFVKTDEQLDEALSCLGNPQNLILLPRIFIITAELRSHAADRMPARVQAVMEGSDQTEWTSIAGALYHQLVNHKRFLHLFIHEFHGEMRRKNPPSGCSAGFLLSRHGTPT